MLVTDDAAAAFDPIDIRLVRDIAADPHQEDQRDSDSEREAQIVVRVFRPLRPFGECVESDQRQEQRTSEGDVQSGDRQDHETGRSHPVHEALERREAHDGAARPPALEPNHAAGQIEDHEHGDHAKNGDAADPAQRHVSEFPPFTARGLYEDSGALIGNADAPLYPIEFLQELAAHCTELAVGLTCWALEGADSATASRRTPARQEPGVCSLQRTP